MATEVRTKTYFLGSMMDLNNGSCNSMLWDSYHDDRNRGCNSFLMSRTMDGLAGCSKEQMRLTILKQESVFRHQLQELHRLYKRQKDLMNEFTMKEHYRFTAAVGAANSSHFLSQVSSQISKEMHTQRRVIDLELPANVDGHNDNEEYQPVQNVHNLSTKRAYNLADLNEPSFEGSVINKNSDYCVADKRQKHDLSTNSKFWYLQAEPKKAYEHLPRNRMIFGVELFETNHKPFFDSSQYSSWDQNTSSANKNRPIEPCEKHEVSDVKKNHEKQLPHWLLKTKAKETTLYQMNLDSLQQHSQQFFQKAEKLQTDHCHGITKILGVPIVNVKDPASLIHDTDAEKDKSKHILESRQEIDLNLSFDEEAEEDPSPTPNIPEAVVKIASMEIDLETPAALEVEPDGVFINADDQELVKSAAEAIVSISSSDPPPTDTLLQWLADLIVSGDGLKDSVNVSKDEDCIPEGLDYFEYMTLKLQETKEECMRYEAVIVAEEEDDGGLLRKQTTRRGQGKRGRQRKDFQRDVLPGLVSLSRREVTEDLQAFEEAFHGIGVSWQSKRKSGGKNGRGRRRLVVPSPPSPPPPSKVVAVEKSVCREVALEEKSLGGWGKRTRRLPRQRCQNGSNHHSLALKC